MMSMRSGSNPTESDVKCLAALAGVPVEDGDLAPVARLLAEHLAFAAPLMSPDLDDGHPTAEPHWDA